MNFNIIVSEEDLKNIITEHLQEMYPNMQIEYINWTARADKWNGPEISNTERSDLRIYVEANL